MREQSETFSNALTLLGFFEYRFKDDKHILRVITTFFILVFFLFYTSSGLVAGGKLFESVFGLPYHWAVIGGALAILAYTVFGGFLAVSWTDLFQGLLMSLALCVTAIVGLQQSGGIESTITMIEVKNSALIHSFVSTDGSKLSFIAWLSLMGWGLGYFGQPHIIVRFMAIKTTSMVTDARRIAVCWTLLSLFASICIGMIGIVYLDTPLVGADSKKVFIELVKLIFHPLIAGICLAAVLAAIMSTADSQLLVASSAVTEDFYKSIFKRDANEKELLIVGKIAVITIAIIATFLAMQPNAKVLELVSYAWAAFGTVLLLSLYWKKMSKN